MIFAPSWAAETSFKYKTTNCVTVSSHASFNAATNLKEHALSQGCFSNGINNMNLTSMHMHENSLILVGQEHIKKNAFGIRSNISQKKWIRPDANTKTLAKFCWLSNLYTSWLLDPSNFSSSLGISVSWTPDRVILFHSFSTLKKTHWKRRSISIRVIANTVR